MSEKGVIIGKQLGHARVYGKAVGVHPFTGQTIIYAEVMHFLMKQMSKF